MPVKELKTEEKRQMALHDVIKKHEILGDRTGDYHSDVQIVYGVDSNFIFPFGVSMTSFLVNNTGG